MKAFHRRVARLEDIAKEKEPPGPWLVWLDGVQPKPEDWDQTERRIHVRTIDGRKHAQ